MNEEDNRRIEFAPYKVRSFLSRWGNYAVAIDITPAVTISFTIDKEHFDTFYRNVKQFAKEGTR